MRGWLGKLDVQPTLAGLRGCRYMIPPGRLSHWEGRPIHRVNTECGTKIKDRVVEPCCIN